MNNNQGATALAAWMTKHQHNQTTFAKLAKLPQPNVSAWLRGAYISLAAAVAIERVTGIPAASWVEPVKAPKPMAKAS